jgi:uncharacterized zinc-type alcohol dehydrogenase-like protein
MSGQPEEWLRSVKAYVTPGPGAPFQPTTIARRELGPRDVLVKIAYAGICHSDIHIARNEWGPARFPLVPGHEIAGTVQAVGPEVSGFGVGERVGVGVIVDSCRECATCGIGEQQHCEAGPVATYNSLDRDGEPTHGGYSTHIVVDERYVLRIREGLALETAAPLLCAGVTMYSPLQRWGAARGRRVAIVGLGGLGHIGVKIAAALGAEVTVLSHTPDKEQDARSLGAHHHHTTAAESVFETLSGSQDLIINTVSAPLELDLYMSMLGLDGVFVNLGLPSDPLTVEAATLVGKRRNLAGSMVGGIRQTQETLDFCTRHGIGADVEVVGGADIDLAYDRVVASDVRYRFVIDTSTF